MERNPKLPQKKQRTSLIMHVFRSAAQLRKNSLLLLLQTKDEGRIHCSFPAKVVAAANKDG
jgi:hypothetical protein